ncbi:MAG: hypothetical protein RIS70_4272, partial [Planctomycetota bacterium]
RRRLWALACFTGAPVLALPSSTITPAFLLILAHSLSMWLRTVAVDPNGVQYVAALRPWLTLEQFFYHHFPDSPPAWMPVAVFPEGRPSERVADLTMLIQQLDERYGRRSIVLVARTGSGKTVAARKAFCDCLGCRPRWVAFDCSVAIGATWRLGLPLRLGFGASWYLADVGKPCFVAKTGCGQDVFSHEILEVCDLNTVHCPATHVFAYGGNDSSSHLLSTNVGKMRGAFFVCRSGLYDDITYRRSRCGHFRRDRGSHASRSRLRRNRV